MPKYRPVHSNSKRVYIDPNTKAIVDFVEAIDGAERQNGVVARTIEERMEEARDADIARLMRDNRAPWL